MEIWKDIPGYEGYYQVSNKGNIKSLQFQCNLTGKKYPREKVLKQKTGKDKCKRVKYISDAIRNNKQENEIYKWELI